MRYSRKDIIKFMKSRDTSEHKITSFFNDTTLSLDTELKDIVTFSLDTNFTPIMNVSSVSRSITINFTKDDIKELKAWIIKVENEL